MATGGAIVVRSLVRWGVSHAFTVPGESFLGLLDALRDSRIRVVATRHEGGASFMAEAFGSLTGKPAVCMATRAVGAANLAIGLHTALQNSTPLLAIIGQVPRAARGREAFQEVDLVETIGGLCKAALEVASADDLAEAVDALLGMATSGRPGPVLLSVPEDVFDEEATAGPREPDPGFPWEPPSLDEASVARVLEAVAAASRPIVVAGSGIVRSGARDLLVRLAESLEVPVVAAWRRPDSFPNEHRLYLGMTGLGGPATVRGRMAEADLWLALGTRLSELTTFDYELPASGTRLIQVDLEPGFKGDRRQPDEVIAADLGAFLDLALGHTSAGTEVTSRRAQNDADRAAFLSASTPPAAAPSSPVNPAAVMRTLRERLPDGTILTIDAGNFGGWAARYLPVPVDGRFLGPTSGAMGYALPAAIASGLAEPDRTIVAMAGDGAFAMLMAEVETAVREGIRLVAIVFDNGMYGTIRMHQEAAHPGRVVATDLGPIDFAAVAQACGARGVRVNRDDQLDEAIGDALHSDGVSILHVRVDPRYLSVDQTLEDP